MSTHNIAKGEHSLLHQGLCISQESSEGDKEVKYNRNLLKSALIHPNLMVSTTGHYHNGNLYNLSHPICH